MILRRLRKRAMTLVEVMVAVTISSMVAVPTLGGIVWTWRMQAQTSDQVWIRTQIAAAVNRMAQDVRDTPSSLTNIPAWEFIVDSGGVEADEQTNPIQVGENWDLNLFSVTRGEQITWHFDAGNGSLSREATNITTNETVEESFRIRFQELIVEEREYLNLIQGEGTVGNEFRSGVQISGRAFLRMGPISTLWRENDEDGDGSLRNDRTGHVLFGLEDRGDRPGWQLVFNCEQAFRNN